MSAPTEHTTTQATRLDEWRDKLLGASSETLKERPERAKSWQKAYVENKLKSRMDKAQTLHDEAVQRSSARAEEALHRAKTSSERKHEEDLVREQKRAQEDSEWQRKKNALLRGIAQSQDTAKRERAEKERRWQLEQELLAARLEDEQARLKKEHQEQDEQLRQQEKELKAQQQAQHEQEQATRARRKANERVRTEESEAQQARWQRQREQEMRDKQARLHETLSQYRETIHKGHESAEVQLDHEWAALESHAESGKPLRLGDIRVPSESQLRRQMRDKKAFQANALRWHPDKFMQRFGQQIVEGDREEALRTVTTVFQVIQRMRKEKAID